MIGKTEKSGWQVGIRKTIPVPVSGLWNLITRSESLKIFTGDSIIAEDISRVTFWGALAMLITAGIGALFGIAV